MRSVHIRFSASQPPIDQISILHKIRYAWVFGPLHSVVTRPFELQSSYAPAGDQPGAIEQLITGIQSGLASQILLGVTGSGKTFTMANVVQALQRPTIVMAHNKTCLLYTSPSPRD